MWWHTHFPPQMYCLTMPFYRSVIANSLFIFRSNIRYSSGPKRRVSISVASGRYPSKWNKFCCGYSLPHWKYDHISIWCSNGKEKKTYEIFLIKIYRWNCKSRLIHAFAIFNQKNTKCKPNVEPCSFVFLSVSFSIWIQLLLLFSTILSRWLSHFDANAQNATEIIFATINYGIN